MFRIKPPSLSKIWRFSVNYFWRRNFCVFCVRAIATEEQAQNLVVALDGLGKHNRNLVIYIDVQPGEILWSFLVQELQARGLEIPVLISIPDEDYNATPINGKAIQYGVVE